MAGIKRDSLITLLEMVMGRLPDDERAEEWSLKFYSKSREYMKSLLALTSAVAVIPLTDTSFTPIIRDLAKRDSLITLLEMVMGRLPDDERAEEWSLKFYSKSREYMKSLLAKSRMIGVKLVSVRGMTATADVRAKVINILVESDPYVNVDDLRGLFSYIQFRSIDISELELENVTDMSRWFQSCHKLKEVKFNRNTDFSNVRSIYEIFADCTSLKKVDLSFANFRSLESAGMAFFNCRELESIRVNKTFRPKSTACIFNLCSHKHELALEMSMDTGMVF